VWRRCNNEEFEMRLSRGLVFLGLVALAACENTAPATPQAPTPTLPAITGVVITGLPTSLMVGQTVQLGAAVTVGDGTVLRTSEAAWASSDVKVVILSATGLLTVTGPGDADVTSIVQRVQGVVHVAIARPIPPPVGYDMSGVVHESAPTENVLLAGATVGIHFVACSTCPHDNQTAVTDEAGRFTLPGIDTPGFTLWVSKPGYDATPYDIVQLPRDQHPDVSLMPAGLPTRSRLVTGSSFAGLGSRCST
jgi:hypothetical protein